MVIGRPAPGEAADYYHKYIGQVGDGDIRELLARQRHDALTFLKELPEGKAGHRYGADKWTLREVVGHLNDCERLFMARAFWFARGFDSALPSFDQNVAMAASGADARSWASHLDEFDAVRAGTVAFVRSLPDPAWDRSGIASDARFTVRALAYIAAGHVEHHLAIVRARYL
jgi:hypothetical protein